MPLLEDLLLRFRRIWSPPGAVVGQPGVPEEAGVRLDEEVRELTAELAAIDADAARQEQAGDAQAAAIREAASAEAQHIVEEARARLPALRAERAASRTLERQAGIERLVEEARRQHEEVIARARARMPELVRGVVDAVFAEAAEEEVAHAGVVGGG